MGKEQSFQQIGQLESHMQKNQVCFFPSTHTEVNSKWIKDFNIRTKPIKLLDNRMM